MIVTQVRPYRADLQQHCKTSFGRNTSDHRDCPLIWTQLWLMSDCKFLGSIILLYFWKYLTGGSLAVNTKEFQSESRGFELHRSTFLLGSSLLLYTLFWKRCALLFHQQKQSKRKNINNFDHGEISIPYWMRTMSNRNHSHFRRKYAWSLFICVKQRTTVTWILCLSPVKLWTEHDSYFKGILSMGSKPIILRTF